MFSSSTKNFSRSVFRTATLGALLLGSLSFSARAGQQQPVEQKVGVETHRLIRSDVSRPLRDIAPIPPDFQDADRAQPVRTWPHFHAPRPLLVEDTVLQADVGPLVSVTPGPTFDGVGFGNYNVTTAPPDTVGAAGLTQYVQWVNSAFAVFNKTTGAIIYGPANGNTLWSGFGTRCQTDNSGDPIVMYDKAANRWIMTQFAVGAQPYLQCIAVSTTSDATGSYRRFAYDFGTQFNDYPKGGVWPDAYYITFNMFANGQTFSGARACAFDRNQMLTASGTPAPGYCFQLSTSFGGLLPSDLDGATPPPAGAPNYHLAFDDVQQNGLNLWKFHIDFTNLPASTFTGPIKIPGATFTEPCGGSTLRCIPQPGTTQKLDSLGDRLMYRLAYRNFGTHESLVANHSVDVSGVTGVRWYEVRSPGGAPTVYQQGTYAPDSTHRWMGSIAQDKDGNVLLGYSASSTAVRPSIRYTGRLATDALGTMQAESEMWAGSGSQLPTLSRWGDYSAMTIDPVDDCTFWYTQEYLQSDGKFNWSTHIAAFKFPSCGTRTDSPAFDAGDLNGDGKSDLLWHNRVTGDVVAFLMNGTAIASVNYVTTVADTSWRIAGTGDFNADSRVDILWRNATSGDVVLFLMSGTSISSVAFVTRVADPLWQIKGVADFNGDGRVDILWHHQGSGDVVMYLMNGSAVSAATYVTRISDLQWQIRGVGDYNGDGRADILWHHQTSGIAYMFLMNGPSISAQGVVGSAADTNWQIRASGDYNGDTRADLLWHHRGTGDVYMFLMNGLTATSVGPVTRIADVAWQIKGAGDYNGDGKDDLLWYHRTGTDVFMFLMNGLSISSAGSVARIGSTDWVLVP